MEKSVAKREDKASLQVTEHLVPTTGLHYWNSDEYWSCFLHASKIEGSSCVHLERVEGSLSCGSRARTSKSVRHALLPQIRPILIRGLAYACTRHPRSLGTLPKVSRRRAYVHGHPWGCSTLRASASARRLRCLCAMWHEYHIMCSGQVLQLKSGSLKRDVYFRVSSKSGICQMQCTSGRQSAVIETVPLLGSNSTCKERGYPTVLQLSQATFTLESERIRLFFIAQHLVADRFSLVHQPDIVGLSPHLRGIVIVDERNRRGRCTLIRNRRKKTWHDIPGFTNNKSIRKFYNSN
ncbi:hypothetical protein M5K25_001472 [Dendrobium thyrsiflorum]|uniref:Uncharacterized protein n=1 Tax=Dendrobium thyrsiflorum TaxID=117978 RepID=A0ABD0VQG5_DENTH